MLLRFVFQVHDKDWKSYSYADVTLKCIPRIVQHSLFSLGSVHTGLLTTTLTLADIAKNGVPIILASLSLRTQCVRALSSTLCLPDCVTVRVPLLLENVSGSRGNGCHDGFYQKEYPRGSSRGLFLRKSKAELGLTYLKTFGLSSFIMIKNKML